jgi:3-deoxy-D-manno-octulosonic acid kinase
MALDSPYKIKITGRSYILYDSEIISDPGVEIFDREHHLNNGQHSVTNLPAGKGVGRAKVAYFHSDNKNLVLKHYFRGGFVARVVKDRYFGFDVERSRAFREWRLLKRMIDLELPVPNAVAAHVRQSLFYYRADLITQLIENSKTLADILVERSIDAVQWKKIASCIKRFHDNNIYHADLNARNILLTEKGEVYLIDFDDSYFRIGSNSWKMENLTRLKRSLLKFKRNESCFNFSEDDWLSFLEGYDQAHG